MTGRAALLREALERTAEEFVAVRRAIHRHPELGFEEFRTSRTVSEMLSSWGYEVHTGLGGTGVVGQLRRGSGQRTIGLRADMDALPLQEATGLAHASAVPHVMHACGHDGHTAILLAAARQLAREGRFDGVVNLIFQPAEEGRGGAQRMIEEGLFRRFPCDAVFALHNVPGRPQGTFIFRDGPHLGSMDEVHITYTAAGGHGAMPHRTADVVVAASSLVMALQTVVSRNVDPMEPCVVTVGAIQAGDAANVMPSSALLRLSARALDPAVREQMRSRIEALARAQAVAFGVECRLAWTSAYPVLVNDRNTTELARQVAIELAGVDWVIAQGRAALGSDDFACMAEALPGTYLLLGNGVRGDDGPCGCSVHSPGYDFNDRNIPLAAAYWCLLVERFLPC